MKTNFRYFNKIISYTHLYNRLNVFHFNLNFLHNFQLLLLRNDYNYVLNDYVLKQFLIVRDMKV